MSSTSIRFYHRGRIVGVECASATRTVLDWLREDARRTGTKEGCNEGDCGACTVVVAELAGAGDARAVNGLRLATVNACIRFLPSLHGKALFTIEDLRELGGGALHPAQQALLDCHGSQCGFCTPGIAMTLWSAYERHRARGSRPTRQQLADLLSGNLCRCTGYRPIVDAGVRMFDLPGGDFDPAPVLAALEALAQDAGPSCAGSYHAPRTLAEFAALRAALPEARVVAGATDVGLWVTKGLRDLGALISLAEVAELKTIAECDGVLRIGAGASLEDAWRALVLRWPELEDLWLRFGSPAVRHAGTMGGNVANGSPIGDSAPVLMALAANIVLRRAEQVRTMPLREFYTGYMSNRLEAGEFVEAIELPLPDPRWRLRGYKIAKRYDCDISALCAGFALRLDPGGGVAGVRLAYGGMAATVRHAERAEAALAGQPWTQASVDAAKAALALDFAPLTDLRASAGYRLAVARNLLQRFWLETRAADPLPAAATSVFGSMPHAAGAAA